ncbi:YqaJ viral recombinase family nuclease [Anaerosinus massiliensis]|uniref:YqaJ viral recombinase family nuclease n=1 Tax=Massilibacillus massiliensis TaxID=1806837 RepID=UPI000AFAB54B|nr:YqaJ viral recombinase family protein [Massilibacillus massiliensis]
MEAIRLIDTRDLSREDWLKARKLGIGGSDIGAILGINNWKSAIDIWMDKTDQSEDGEQSEAAYWGNMLEELVAKEFEIRTAEEGNPIKVRRCNAILQHPEIPYMLANVDRLIVGQDVGLECKTTSAYNNSEWEDDKLPDSYYLQCQHYMAVTGYKSWYIAVLIGGQKFKYKLVERDEEMIKIIFERAAEFWKHVENKTMPSVNGTEACTAALKKLFPEGNGNSIELPDTADIYIKQYEQADFEERAAKERKTEAQNTLQNMLGENESGTIAGRLVNWKTTKGRSTFDSKTFGKAYPDLCKQYTNDGVPSRRFSIK